MATVAQVLNRSQPPPSARFYAATVTVPGNPATSEPVTVELEVGDAETTGFALNGATYVVGDRVLLVVSGAGNYILGTLT
jgi:hypothetical protein